MDTQHKWTAIILKWFDQISAIPRNSKHEAAICEWLGAWAEQRGFPARGDAAGNIVIEVPGSAGYEASPPVVIQGHMDMVCEKTKDSTHDFSTDPIKLVYDGDWLRADRTTLGADNGIAIAMAMTAATEADVPHPPLELLFTVDEETGLTGANALEPGFIKGKILLNVDSEDEGVFTVGCAGGRDTHLFLPIEREAAAGCAAFQVTVGGLRGGHSGIDIQGERGNAIRLLGRALDRLLAAGDMRLASISGGSAHNAIPRDAEAVVLLSGELAAAAPAIIEGLDAALKAENANVDPGVAVTLEPAADGAAASAWTVGCTRCAVALLLGTPHGVESFSTDIKGLVETSNNLATVRVDAERMVVQSSQRSSSKARLDFLTRRIESVGHLAGASAESGEGYPAWKPNMDSPLLATCKALYTELFDKQSVVEIIHAGLECGIIGAKNEGMDMISFGPTIENPHSPEERIHIGTIGLVWDFLAALLKRSK